MNTPPPSRYRIVPQNLRRGGRWLPWALAGAWLLSLLATWIGASRLAAPRLAATQQELAQAQGRVAGLQQQVAELKQQQVNLALSDRISRAANSEVQASLAEREEEIASLRADVAFYERLVGATGQRKGLNVHSAEFSPEAGGTWHYTVVLTQNLNRGAVSEGQMRFTVEGVHAGRLTTVSWDELHQRTGVPGQAYSFRYFQQLDGSVILPKDFTPQRVRVSLAGGTPVNQTFEWKLAGNGSRGE